MRRFIALLALALVVLLAALLLWQPTREVLRTEVARRVPALRDQITRVDVPIATRLQQKGFALGQPVLIRIFKEESQLEVWIKKSDRFELFDTYAICRWSGTLGPKLKEGDGQSPEGFYFASSKQLLPTSRYHRAINTGFPNVFDQELGRTGSVLMIHGSCVSIGCYAMTDPGIDDIYNMIEAALDAGSGATPIHIFPFRMRDENFERHANNVWMPYWKNLAEGDAMFMKTKTPPAVFACGERYVFEGSQPGCRAIEAW